MKTVELALEPILEYLISLERDPINGWYFLKIGLPNNWVINENDQISFEVLNELSTGKVIKIIPKNDKIIVDDLITFVLIIIKTNQKIAEKEKQFTDKMEEMKSALEKEAVNFYKELDLLKESSFKKIDVSILDAESKIDDINKKDEKPKPSKSKSKQP